MWYGKPENGGSPVTGNSLLGIVAVWLWLEIKGHVVALSPLHCWGGEENGKKKAKTGGSG